MKRKQGLVKQSTVPEAAKKRVFKVYVDPDQSTCPMLVTEDELLDVIGRLSAEIINLYLWPEEDLGDLDIQEDHGFCVRFHKWMTQEEIDEIPEWGGA